MNFNSFQTTRGNKYKLQKFVCHYNLRKYSFCSRVVNVWNSLPNYVVEADTINIVKNRLDKHWGYWLNQEVLFNFNADLTGSEVYQFVCEHDCKMRAKRIPPAPVIPHWIGLHLGLYARCGVVLGRCGPIGPDVVRCGN